VGATHGLITAEPEVRSYILDNARRWLQTAIRRTACAGMPPAGYATSTANNNDPGNDLPDGWSTHASD